MIVGFATSMDWIELSVNELVNVLTTLGVISSINLDILGLTILAWGNSTDDMFADLSVSRHGYSKMAISAAISRTNNEYSH